MLTETLLKQPGFLYKIGQKHYYLGKWIGSLTVEYQKKYSQVA